MPPFHERLQTVLDTLDVNPAKFAERIGIQRAGIYNMLKSGSKPGLEILEKMCLAYPEISTNFLLRGEGMPLSSLDKNDEVRSIQHLWNYQLQEVLLQKRDEDNALVKILFEFQQKISDLTQQKVKSLQNTQTHLEELRATEMTSRY